MRYDFLIKVLPVIVSFATAYFSFTLSKQKSDREKEADQYKRLNEENDKLTAELDKYRHMVNSRDEDISRLRGQLLNYMSKAATATKPVDNDNDKEDTNIEDMD